MSGVEIEGLTPAFGGEEVVVDGRAGRPSRVRRRTVGAIAAVVVLAIAVAATRGGKGATTASTVTPATAATDAVTSSSSTTSTEPPTTLAADVAPTTTTTVVRHDVTFADLGVQVTFSTVATIDRLALRVRSGLTVARSDSGAQSARFDDLDSGLRTTVFTNPTAPGSGLNFSTTVFAGGAVTVASTAASDIGPAVFRSILLYANGAAVVVPGLGAPVQSAFGASLTSPTWFTDTADPHVMHLVDLATATILRSATLPPVAVPVGVDGAMLVVADPAGRFFDLADDGSLSPRASNLYRHGSGRRTELACDDALGSCVLDYLDEGGNRTTIVDAEHALTTAAVVSPAGPHLAALVPLVQCARGCPPGDPPQSLLVRDIDRGTTYTVGTSTAAALGFGPRSELDGGVGFATPSIGWSSDGTWLFFTSKSTDGTSTVGAWHPGLFAPVELSGNVTDVLLGGNGPGAGVVFPTETPMPAPTG